MMLSGLITQAMNLTHALVGLPVGSPWAGPCVGSGAGLARPCLAAATGLCVLAFSMVPAQSGSESIALSPDQLAIIESIAKPQGGNTVGYAGAPTDPIGAQVRLPFGEGRFITLRRKGSTLREDGSISWHG